MYLVFVIYLLSVINYLTFTGMMTIKVIRIVDKARINYYINFLCRCMFTCFDMETIKYYRFNSLCLSVF